MTATLIVRVDSHIKGAGVLSNSSIQPYGQLFCFSVTCIPTFDTVMHPYI